MIFIGIAGALGAITRFVLGKWITSLFSASFPFHTLIINIIGSFFLGLTFSTFHTYPDIYSTISIGFLGSLTTFSTFSYELFILWKEKKYIFVLIYLLSSILLCITFTYLGLIL